MFDYEYIAETNLNYIFYVIVNVPTHESQTAWFKMLLTAKFRFFQF